MCEKNQQNWADRHWPAVWEVVENHLMLARPTNDGRAYVFPTLRVNVRAPAKPGATVNPVLVTLRQTSPQRGERGAELDQIMDGDGDWLFYAQLAEDGETFAVWQLVDLHELRKHLNASECPVGVKLIHWTDGSEWIHVNLARAPRSLIVASSTAELDPQADEPLDDLRPEDLAAAA